MTSLANILGLDPTQTVLVNLITEFSTYCTSIVARTTSNQIVHTRNLDFMHTDVMKQLVYKAIFVKDNNVVAHAPLIAGFMGAYTGQKPGVFSVSYNSRHSQATLDIEIIRANLWRTLDPSYIPTQSLIEQLLLTSKSFQEAVTAIEERELDSPAYVILGGLQDNQGVVFTRDFDKPTHA